MRSKAVFYLNGIRMEAGPEHASMMLSEYLRYEQALTGTKIVCAEGDCGACTVLRYFPHIEKGVDADKFIPVNSCITLVAQLDGSSLVTVDALKTDRGLHEAQRAMVDYHGSQCGFCTPGFVMALAGLVEEKLERGDTTIDEQEAKNSMTGNLCRCTGYQPIIDAALDIDLAACETVKSRFFSEKQADDLDQAFQESLHISSDTFSFFAPKTLDEAVDWLQQNPDAKIIASATDLGVVHNKRRTKLTQLLSLHLIRDLYDIGYEDGFIKLGARVTHTELRHFLKRHVPEFAAYLDLFASPQIKNIGTVVGNVANASPIGDVPPVLLVLDTEVLTHGSSGKRTIPITDFFVDYRKTRLEPGEIIEFIRFKTPKAGADFRLYKNSNRKDLDISTVNLAIHAVWGDDKKSRLQDIRIAAGGVAAKPVRFPETEKRLMAANLSPSMLEEVISGVHTEFSPISDLRGSKAFRHLLVENLIKRFFKECGFKEDEYEPAT